MGLYGYMTEINLVDNLTSECITAQGTDMLSLLYNFLDEFLFLFNAEPYFIGRVSTFVRAFSKYAAWKEKTSSAKPGKKSTIPILTRIR